MQHERGPRTSTIRKQVALYFRGHKEENGTAAHFPSAALPAPAFFTAVTQLEPHGLELATVSTTPERQTLVSLAQPTPKVSSLLGPRRPEAGAKQRAERGTPHAFRAGMGQAKRWRDLEGYLAGPWRELWASRSFLLSQGCSHFSVH